MLFHEAFQPGGGEEAPLGRALAEHEGRDPRMKGLAARWGESNRHPPRTPREDLGRHEVRDGTPQHSLRLKAAKLEAVRYRRRVLDGLVIEEGHAALDRRRHAHLVLLH